MFKAIAVDALVVGILSAPAVLRAHRIARIHRRFGPAAWLFIIAVGAAGSHADA